MTQEEKDNILNEYVKKFKRAPFFFELQEEDYNEEWFIKRVEDAIDLDDPEIFIDDKVEKGVDY